MAYPVASVQARTDGTNSASIAFADWFDSQINDDIIVVVGHNDANATALSISGTWTELHGPAPLNSGVRTAVWWARRSGSDIPAPTVSGSTSPWACAAILIRDVDATTAIDVSAVTEQTSSTQTPTAPTVTTTVDGCLVIHIVGHDGGTQSSFPAGLIGQAVTLVNMCDTEIATTTAASVNIECWQQNTAGATGTFGWVNPVSDGGRQMTIAFRPKSGGGRYIRPTTTGITVVDDLSTAGTVVDISTLHATLDSVTVQAATVRNSVSGISPSELTANGMPAYIRAIGSTQVATTGPAGIYGAVRTLPAPVDASNSLILFGHQISSNTTQAASGGYLYFRDTPGAWKLWRPIRRSAAASWHVVCAYLPGETYVDSGGTFDWTQLAYIGTAINATATVASNNNREHALRPIILVSLSTGKISVVGGNSVRPVGWRDIYDAVASGIGYQYARKLANAANAFVPTIQIGDGTNPTYFVGEGTLAEFPTRGSLTGFLPRSLDLDLRVNACATCTVDLSATSLVSGTIQKFTIDSASSTSATYDLGATVVGFRPTLKTGIPVIGAKFSRCDEIDAQGATLTDCAISGTTSTAGAIEWTANPTVTGTTFDVTGTSAAYHVELGTSVTAATFTGCTFLGTPGTDKIHVKRTTGTVTITSDTLVVGDVTSDGASIVISNPSSPTVSITAIVAGSRLRIYNVTTTTEIHNAVVAGTSYSTTYTEGGDYTTGDTVEITLAYQSGVTAKLCYEATTTASASGWSITAQQQDDTVYNAIGVNGASVTGFAADYVNDEVNVTVASNFNVADLYAWWVYNLTTSQGIAEFCGGITAVDQANFRINNATVDIYIDNATATNLRQLDNRRIFRADEAYPVKSSGGGGIDVVWRNTVLIAETGTSGLTAGEAATLAKLDTLTEDVSGLRFTAKALETAPASGVSTGSTFNHPATGFTLTSGNVTAGSYSVTAPRDGVLHTIAYSGGLDFYYSFQIDTGNVPTAAQMYLSFQGNNHILKVYGYDFVGAAWGQIGTIVGTGQALFKDAAFVLYSHFVNGSGEVRVRFSSTDAASTVSMDQIYVAYGADTVNANVTKMNGATVIGTGTTGDSWRGVGVAP